MKKQAWAIRLLRHDIKHWLHFGNMSHMNGEWKTAGRAANSNVSHILKCAFCGNMCAFLFISIMGKNEWVDQFPPDQGRAEEHVFSTPRGLRNNGIIFFFFLNVAFLLEKMVTYLKGQGGEKQQKNKKETERKERIIEKRIAGEDRHQEVGGRGEAGRDLDRGEGIYCHTCEHLPTHILQVSEQPETSSKGWLWETGGKQDSQELWERTWSETHDVIFKSLHQRGRYKYRAAGSLRSCERRRNTQMEKDTFMSSSPSVKCCCFVFF